MWDKVTMKWPLGLIYVFVFSSCATIQKDHFSVKNQEVIPLFGSFSVNRYTFENDLRLLVLEDHSSPTFAYQTWFKVGSINEVPGYSGLAHLFEHLMFKQTENRTENESNRLLEGVGTEGRNAYTSHDYTAYIQELPTGNLDLIAQLESDRMSHLIVDQKTYVTEREVVQNERRSSRENDPDGKMYDQLYDLAFKKHPYHWPTIGYEADLNRMTEKDAAKFYHDYYSPNHATIVVVGDVKADEVKATVEKYYGQYKKKSGMSHEIPVEPEQKAAIHKTIKMDIRSGKLLLGYRVPGMMHPDMPAEAVLQTVLGSGRSSRLYRLLVDTGLASSIQAYDVGDKDPSLLIFAVELQKGTPAQVEALILKEFEKISKILISDSELRRAKNKIHFEYIEGLGSNYRKASFLGQLEVQAGDFEEGIKYYEKIKSLTTEDVKKVAKKYLAPHNRTVVIGVPK